MPFICLLGVESHHPFAHSLTRSLWVNLLYKVPHFYIFVEALNEVITLIIVLLHWVVYEGNHENSSYACGHIHTHTQIK